MGRYLVRRTAQLLPLLFLVTSLSYLIVLAAPGSPEQILLGPAGANVDPGMMATLRQQWGLNDPWYVQYGRWLWNMVHGDFGYSLVRHRPVLDLILERLPATLLLMGTVTLVTYAIALPLGILSAMWRHSWLDHGVTLLGLIGYAMPNFWVGTMLIFLVAVPSQGLIPTSGMSDPNVTLAGNGLAAFLLDRGRFLLLPVLTLAMAQVAGLSRYVRSQMLEVIQEEYIRTARAKGLSERVVMVRHALRNAILPIVTLSGRLLTVLFSGAVITEQVFSWPGLGWLAIRAADERDYPVVMAFLMIGVVLDIVGNFLVDVLYVWADPRIRYS